MIKTTEMTANDAKRLLQGCLVQAIAKQEEEPRFVPQTDDWDLEFEEQRTLAEDRIAELDGQTVSERYDGEVLTRVRRLLTRNGFSQHDISEARFKDLANCMARILVEQQKLFLARIEDRFAAYIRVEARLTPPGGNPERLSGTSYATSYWTPAQLVTHQASNGCPLSPGDILGTGTISGPDADEAGALLELGKMGTAPLTLADGTKRAALLDGDRLTLAAHCERAGFKSIGFGEADGSILAAES